MNIRFAADDDIPANEVLHAQLRGFFSEKLSVEVSSVDADLVQTGFLDSLALVELFAYSAAAFERLRQINMLKAKIRTCYLALDHDEQPCYMQWLIPSSENDKIQAFYGDIFPRLDEDEALLECAYTVDDYRGQGIMGNAMAQIAERAAELGVQHAITFVGVGHVASLKGCKKAGFVPYLRRREIYRLFRRKVTFTPLPEGTPYPFELENEQPRAPNADK